MNDAAKSIFVKKNLLNSLRNIIHSNKNFYGSLKFKLVTDFEKFKSKNIFLNKSNFFDDEIIVSCKIFLLLFFLLKIKK